MLITFTGRKSGKVFATPVNYVREGDDITVFSYRHRAWWRNLRGGAPVTLRVKGQDLKAVGESIEDKNAVAAGLLAYLRKMPHYAKYFQVTIDPNGQPNPEEVARAAQNRVMIRFRLARAWRCSQNSNEAQTAQDFPKIILGSTKQDEKELGSKDILYRLGLFTLFLTCGLSIFVPSIFMTEDIKTIYKIAIPILFLLSAVLLHRNKHLEKYFQVFYAFFMASLVSALEHIVVGAIWPKYKEGILPSAVDGIVFQKLLSTLLVAIPIVLLTKISGKEMASIYLRKGKLRLGLVIGLATFLIFLLTSVPAATVLFGARGQNLTSENLISWAPWVAAFVLSNGLREELWFRGLFLKKYESFLGVDTSNFLQAIIFSLAHLGSQYTPFLLIFLVITFFLGLAFGAVIQKTDSLMGSILFHAGTDIPAVLGYFSSI